MQRLLLSMSDSLYQPSARHRSSQDQRDCASREAAINECTTKLLLLSLSLSGHFVADQNPISRKKSPILCALLTVLIINKVSAARRFMGQSMSYFYCYTFIAPPLMSKNVISF
jgi:hypothetical protein